MLYRINGLRRRGRISPRPLLGVGIARQNHPTHENSQRKGAGENEITVHRLLAPVPGHIHSFLVDGNERPVGPQGKIPSRGQISRAPLRHSASNSVRNGIRVPTPAIWKAGRAAIATSRFLSRAHSSKLGRRSIVFPNSRAMDHLIQEPSYFGA